MDVYADVFFCFFFVAVVDVHVYAEENGEGRFVHATRVSESRGVVGKEGEWGKEEGWL